MILYYFSIAHNTWSSDKTVHNLQLTPALIWSWILLFYMINEIFIVLGEFFSQVGTLIFSHIRRLGPFFWVQNSEFQYFFGFPEKWIFFGGIKILWIVFWSHHKIGLVRGSFLSNLWSFLSSRYRIGIFIGVAKSSNIFFGCLKFLIFFWGVNGRC